MKLKKATLAKAAKATLYSLDGKNYSFAFKYNPTSISITESISLSENGGARTEKDGIPKVSFACPEAKTISIQDIVFDSYEDDKGKDVFSQLQQLTKAVKFISGEQRPPVYLFRWGAIHYAYCYVESIDYELTMFSPDGTPVRANASISMKEVDPYDVSSNPPPKPKRGSDTRWL